MKEAIQKLAKKYPSIKLVYLFGSRARGDFGTLSDYDFAIHLDEPQKEARTQLQLELINELSSMLETDAIDLVILNDVDKPELKYDILREGQLLYEEEPFSLIVEPQILSKYFDFREGLRSNHLTKA